MNRSKPEQRSPLIPPRLVPTAAANVAQAETASALAIRRQIEFIAQQHLEILNNTEKLSRSIDTGFKDIHDRMDRLEAKRKVESTEIRHHIETTEGTLERLLSRSEQIENISEVNGQIYAKVDHIYREFLQQQKLGSTWQGHGALSSEHTDYREATSEHGVPYKSDQGPVASSSSSTTLYVGQNQTMKEGQAFQNPEIYAPPIAASSSEASTLYSTFTPEALSRTESFTSRVASPAQDSDMEMSAYPYNSPPHLLPARFTESPSMATDTPVPASMSQFVNEHSQEEPQNSLMPPVASTSTENAFQSIFSTPIVVSSRELSPLTPIFEPADLPLTVDPRVFMMSPEEVEGKANVIVEKSKKRRKRATGNTSSKRMRMSKANGKKKAIPVVIEGVEWPANIEGETCIRCEGCHQWYHFGCVGIPPNDARLRDEKFQFHCPPCRQSENIAGPSTDRVSPAPGGRQECQRPNCQFSSTADETYVISRLIAKMYGQQVEGSTKPLCMWLVEWEGYDVLDSTWEWEYKMSDPRSLISAFEAVIDKVLIQDAEILKEVVDRLPANQLGKLLET